MDGLVVGLSALEAEPRSYHPTIAGQHALAQLFITQIEKGAGRTLSWRPARRRRPRRRPV
jgi:hypothetical protein